MRTSSHTPRSQRTPSNTNRWIWGVIIISILGILITNSLRSHSSEGENSGKYLNILPGSGSEVYIKPAKGSAKLISEKEQLYTTDSSLSVSNGTTDIASDFISATADKNSELVYMTGTSAGEVIEFSKGRLWVESKGANTVIMKNVQAKLKNGDIVLFEQPNQIFSTLYVLKGDVEILANDISYTVVAGKKIMVSKSDLTNPNTSLSNLAGDIGESIKENPLFMMKNGARLLDTLIQNSTGSSSVSINSSGTLSSTPLSGGTTSNILIIDSPKDEQVINTPTIDITGRMFSKEIRRVTINDIDTLVSPVNETFLLKGFKVSSDITNIVYKAYNKDSQLLDKGVITLYGKKTTTGVERLTPNNFAPNNKDFRITAPLENPYITTDASITVSGVVPKNTVQYIMVNNFRLKKFIPNSTSWYYYANTDYDTLKEGINLYEISFYGNDDTLLYTQLFTIVKERKPVVSGELIPH